MMDPFVIQKLTTWSVVIITERVDSFNLGQLQKQINEMIDKGQVNVVIDLEDTIFLSLLSIKYLATLAEKLGRQGGSLALLAPSEKLKRQIHIYATLDEMKFFRSRQDLERMGGEPVPFSKHFPNPIGEEGPEAAGIL